MESAVARRTAGDGATKAGRVTSNLCALNVLLDGTNACDEVSSRIKESADACICNFMFSVVMLLYLYDEMNSTRIENYEKQ